MAIIRWIRLVLAILAVAGVLAARPGIAAPAGGAQHNCMGMADDDKAPSGGLRTSPVCCVAAVCAVVQPTCHAQHALVVSLVFTQVPLPLRDDLRRSGVRPPPGLRPPIA